MIAVVMSVQVVTCDVYIVLAILSMYGLVVMIADLYTRVVLGLIPGVH